MRFGVRVGTGVALLLGLVDGVRKSLKQLLVWDHSPGTFMFLKIRLTYVLPPATAKLLSALLMSALRSAEAFFLIAFNSQ